LTTVFAPATLSVTRSQSFHSSIIEVSNIGISNGSLETHFVSYPRQDLYPNRASPLARIIGAVAMSDQQESLQPSALQPNISYQLHSYVPLLRCSSANTTAQAQLITMLLAVSNDHAFGEIPLTTNILNNQTFH
jgi:hypothetical protein